eukprot:jgi/Tetstr1/443569/TSEL_031570.t1
MSVPGSPPQLPGREEVSIDAALQSTVGEFGRGQQLFYGLAQLGWLPGALLTLVMVYTNLDPIGQRWYNCLPGPGGGRVHRRDERLRARRSGDGVLCAAGGRLGVDAQQGQHRVRVESRLRGGVEAAGRQHGLLLRLHAGSGLLWLARRQSWPQEGAGLSALVSGVGGMLCAVAGGYWSFFLFRLITGVGVAGIGMVGYVLGCEFVGPSWRGLLGVAAQCFFAVGCFVLPFLAYKVPNWRAISLLCGGSAILYLLVLPYLPESPRWHLIQGRKGEATATLAAIASYNRTRMPDVPLADVVVTSGRGAGMGDVLAHRVLRARFLVQIVAWVSVSCTYYGISLMVADLPGDMYSNNAMMALVEMFAYIAASILVDRLGRRWTIAGSYLLGGVCLILSALCTGSWRLGLALAAKLGAASAFALIFLYAAELFPTVVRNVCIGACSQAARIGGMSTPVIIMIAKAIHFPLLTFLVLGASSTAAGLLLLTQPETLGSVMAETIQDVGSESPKAQELKTWRREGGSTDCKSPRPSYFARFTRGRGFSRMPEDDLL